MKNAKNSVKSFNKKALVVAAGYADYLRIGSIHPIIVVEIAKNSGCDVVMLDTAIKDGKSIFDILTIDQCKDFFSYAKKSNLLVALAGSIKKEHLRTLKEIGVDIIGIRGAVCENNDRLHGNITYEKIKEFQDAMMRV
jgi:uncharacterized protein (UPF0264 family)